ncbi:MAG TPA: Rrf2 family transcriptional regulator, partial [Sporolactobacillaceae bacterium]|nr:Rrf2 family transcriptional regulator [Sporolactobacillaceae bacterium]
MKLTQFTDYSLRVLIFLGALEKEERVNVQEIASIYKISKHHLTKVVHNLGKLGLVDTLRGRGGGIRLAKQPSEINIGWLVRETEETIHLVECFDPEENGCFINSICSLKGILNQGLEAYFTTLDQFTLEDVLSQRSALRTLLVKPDPV